MPISVASCSFSKLKLIKTYMRSTMTQDKLTSLSLLSIEHAYIIDSDTIPDTVISGMATILLQKRRTVILRTTNHKDAQFVDSPHLT